MTLTLPDAARFVARDAFAARICRFWPLRNTSHQPTRVLARASIRYCVSLIRQLQP
jgi:hypothetical protein